MISSASSGTTSVAKRSSPPTSTFILVSRPLAAIVPSINARTDASTRRPPPDEAPMSTLETPIAGHLPSAGSAPASRRSSSFNATRSRDRVTTSRSWAGASSPLGPRPMMTAPRGGASSTASSRRISPSRCGYCCISNIRSSRPSDRLLSWASAPVRGRPWKCPTRSRYVACSRLPWSTLTWSGLRAGGGATVDPAATCSTSAGSAPATASRVVASPIV